MGEGEVYHLSSVVCGPDNAFGHVDNGPRSWAVKDLRDEQVAVGTPAGDALAVIRLGRRYAGDVGAVPTQVFYCVVVVHEVVREGDPALEVFVPHRDAGIHQRDVHSGATAEVPRLVETRLPQPPLLLELRIVWRVG